VIILTDHDPEKNTRKATAQNNYSELSKWLMKTIQQNTELDNEMLAK
jgi:hypothetical protein